MKELRENQAPARSFWSDERGSATLEWALMLSAIGLPAYFVIQRTLDALTGYYQMMTFLNSLPVL